MKPLKQQLLPLRNVLSVVAQKLLPEEKSWHVAVIHAIAQNIKPEHYLEVGIYKGETFRKIAKCATYAVGVDIEAKSLEYVRKINSSIGFHGTLQEYVSTQPKQKFDLIFIDADHMEESVVADFASALEVASHNAVIMLHDTWPKSEEFAGPGYCGTSYLAVNSLRERYSDWSFVTIPVHPGLTIASKNNLPTWTD
jgi:predicted O-methyltransferase YrrM